MPFTHKPGSDYGIDYGVIATFLLWVLATIILLVALAVRGWPHGI
jgi:tetrahydromethanopterin S-methyltransferase subunit G